MNVSHVDLERAASETALGAPPLAQLIRCHSASIRALLHRLGVHDPDVDDVMQRVWLTALRWSTRLQPGRERAFLFTVARREAGHTRRTYRRRAEVSDVDIHALQSGSLPADEVLTQVQRAQQVEGALAAMDGDLRDIFVALASGKATSSDLAHRLGIPLGTVKSRWRRARRVLAALECRECW
jgi:RNA polymerase sigma-70 factor (ECF subfamily)